MATAVCGKFVGHHVVNRTSTRRSKRNSETIQQHHPSELKMLAVYQQWSHGTGCFWCFWTFYQHFRVRPGSGPTCATRAIFGPTDLVRGLAYRANGGRIGYGELIIWKERRGTRRVLDPLQNTRARSATHLTCYCCTFSEGYGACNNVDVKITVWRRPLRTVVYARRGIRARSYTCTVVRTRHTVDIRRRYGISVFFSRIFRQTRVNYIVIVWPAVGENVSRRRDGSEIPRRETDRGNNNSAKLEIGRSIFFYFSSFGAKKKNKKDVCCSERNRT